MKIAFIYSGYENLGIECLSASLKINGFDTKLFFDPILFSESGFLRNKFLGKLFSFEKQLLKDILAYHPDLLCFSVISDNYIWASNLAKRIKEASGIPVVFGGIHPTSVPERVIIQPFVDFVCVGEGDQALVELAEAIRGNKSLNSIKNIWAKDGLTIIRNPVRPPIPDLDTLPMPDKDLFYAAAPIFREGYLISSVRGCPFSCSYCCNNLYHQIYGEGKDFLRRRSPENVIEELKLAKSKYRHRFVNFADDVFSYNRPWLKVFLEMYRKSINLPFSCYVYPDLVDRIFAEELKNSGCFKIQMGVQIINEKKMAEVLKRDSSQEKISQAIMLFKQNGIYVSCDNIFGLPGEREEDLVDLFDFYDKYTPDCCEPFWLRYYPKTEITGWALENNYISRSDVQMIEEGEIDTGLMKTSELLKIKPSVRKMISLLMFYPFLPKKVRRYIVRKKIYNYLPCFSNVTLLIISRIIKRSKYDFNSIRTAKRYFYFCFKKLFWF